MSPSWEETAEKLTQQAVEAAEEGRWGMVDLCYQGRAELFRANDVSLSLGRRLHSLDGRVQDRLRMAMMTVQHLLTEVASKQRLLERFDSEFGSDVFPERSRQISRRV
ncbi:MAG TPA: hypothetical protein VFI05_12020 [Nitrospiraceae bacterium]|nr:hypothetical protein [Nitrospiraceae bacterium]